MGFGWYLENRIPQKTYKIYFPVSSPMHTIWILKSKNVLLVWAVNFSARVQCSHQLSTAGIENKGIYV